MATEGFVADLVNDLKPVRRRSVARDALILSMICAIELCLFFGMGTLRSDIPAAMEQPSFWCKLASLGLIAGVGSRVAISSLDPVESPRRGLLWLTAIAATGFVVGWNIDAGRYGLSTLAARLNWREGVQCVDQIVLLSSPAMVVLAFLMRRGASTDTGGTALTVGIAAAAWGAFVFVFSCPYDDPLYTTVWYGVGCGLVIVLARLVLPLLTRW